MDVEKMNEKVSDNSSTDETPIQQFYNGQKIFITGGTGFVGRVLTEKLLRSCPNVSTIYLLIRPKKGKSIETRLQEIFNAPLYHLLRKERPNFQSKVVPISGDCNDGLNISDDDRNLLINEVSIVFHGAASVRFEENLKSVVAVNMRSTAEVLNLAKQMKKLKVYYAALKLHYKDVFMYVSTAFSFSNRADIGECLYPHPISTEDIFANVKAIPNDEIEEMTPKIIQDWPNTYTYTKAGAEVLIKDRSNGIPVGIYRPSIIVGAAREPIPGWIDNIYGASGLTVALISGVIRVMRIKLEGQGNIVPIDYSVNALIASAWEVALQTNQRNENVTVYNYISQPEDAINYTEYLKWTADFMKKYPPRNVVWIMSWKVIENETMYNIAKFFYHQLPALVLDAALISTGQKPRVWKLYTRIHKFLRSLYYFHKNKKSFKDDNIVNLWNKLDARDQQIFYFNMKGFDWNQFYIIHLHAQRLYIFNETLDTVEYAKIKQRRMYWLDWIVKIIFVILVFYIFYRFYGILFGF